MTPTHSDFLRAIIASPADDLPRLAYADWLEENGEAGRAEFIRVQCESPKDALHERSTPGVDKIYRRGFIGEIRCTLSKFFGATCERCDGEGRWYDDEGYYERGWRKCKHCHGTGRTPALGPQIFRDHPVTRVVITDVVPSQVNDHRDRSQWTYFQGTVNSGYHLPTELFYGLQKTWFPTREAAIDALSNACVRWARAEANKLEPVAV